MNKYRLWILFCAALALRLVLLPFAQETDPDAVTRVFHSIQWLDSPEWITNSIWGPFHIYLNGFFLSLYNDVILVPPLINILLFSCTVFPFYFLVKREFSRDGAFASAVFFILTPVLFHNSLLALSCTPYLFFLILGINCLSKGIRTHRWIYILCAGTFVSIAAGYRYEAWLLGPVLAMMPFFARRYWYCIVFLILALAFPVYWLSQSYLSSGDAFFSFEWLYQPGSQDASIDIESLLRRIWYYPFSWIIAFGPVGIVIVFIAIVKGYRNLETRKRYFLLSAPIWIVFIVMMAGSASGTVLMQHRFSSTLVVLSLPFIAGFFTDLNRKRIQWLVGSVVTMLVLSFFYNTSGVRPVPRLQDQQTVSFSGLIKENCRPGDIIIYDFLGWENTYYLALHSGLHPESLILPDGNDPDRMPIEKINSVLGKEKAGMIILRSGSEFSKITSIQHDTLRIQDVTYEIPVTILFKGSVLTLYRYSR